MYASFIFYKPIQWPRLGAFARPILGPRALACDTPDPDWFDVSCPVLEMNLIALLPSWASREIMMSLLQTLS